MQDNKTIKYFIGLFFVLIAFGVIADAIHLVRTEEIRHDLLEIKIRLNMIDTNRDK